MTIDQAATLRLTIPEEGTVIKALSLHQPWATLIALGEKRFETRDWDTKHRGWVAIHAAGQMPPEARAICMTQPFLKVLSKRGYIDGFSETKGRRTLIHSLPLGAVVALAYLQDTHSTNSAALPVLLEDRPYERYFGNYNPDRYAFSFSRVVSIDPVACRGMLGLWSWTVATVSGMPRMLEV